MSKGVSEPFIMTSTHFSLQRALEGVPTHYPRNYFRYTSDSVPDQQELDTRQVRGDILGQCEDILSSL